MAVKLPGQHYVTYLFIIPCLKSIQVAMEALCLYYEESDFKKQIVPALKRSVDASSSTPGPEKTREKLIIFDFNEMNIELL